MTETNRIAAARNFVRSLNLVLKSARMYGLEHARTTAQFGTAWSDLQTALSSGGEGGLLLGVAAGKLLVDGTPVEITSVEKSFVDMLSAAGLASTNFAAKVTQEDLRNYVGAFAAAGAKNVSLSEQLKTALGESPDARIRVNKVRFIAEDSSLPEGASLPRIATQSLPKQEAQKIQDWINDPLKLLQLISAAERSPSGVPVATEPSAAVPSDSVAAAAPAFGSTEDWSRVMKLLSMLGDTTKNPNAAVDPAAMQQQVTGLSPQTQDRIQKTISALGTPGGSGGQHLLVELAEKLALQFALDRLNEAPASAGQVRGSLDQMGKEIESLRKVLSSHEDKMAKAGLGVDSYSEILDRQFWAGVPEAGKRAVLLSGDAWCIPPRNVSQFVEELANKGDAEAAGAVLFSYATCIHSPDPEARKKTAVGLLELARAYAMRGVRYLDFAIYHVGEQVGRENDADLQAALSNAFIRLSQEATTRREYPAVQQVLSKLESIQLDQPVLAERLRPRIGVETRLHDFIDMALREPAPPEALIEVLQHIPAAAAEQLATRFNRCTRREECDKLVELLRRTGRDSIHHLRETLRSGSEPAAVSTVGLLSRLDQQALIEHMPARLPSWRRAQHDTFVRLIAFGAAPERGRLLMSWLDFLDPLVLPEAVDEVGLCNDSSAAPRLVQLANGEIEKFSAPYLRIKAIEALGRMRESKAAPALRTLAQAKGAFRWTHPRELRIVAMQALQKIDPEWTAHFLPQSGLTEAELQNAPLDAAASADWARARRYPRVQIGLTLPATARNERSTSNLTIRVINMGGGLAASDGKLPAGADATFELRSGLRSIRAQILLREAKRDELSFEFARVEFEERGKLRKLITGLHTVAA